MVVVAMLRVYACVRLFSGNSKPLVNVCVCSFRSIDRAPHTGHCSGVLVGGEVVTEL